MRRSRDAVRAAFARILCTSKRCHSGLFRPWRLTESPAAIHAIVGTFLRTRKAGAPAAAELTDLVTFASVHDVVAVFKWVRHDPGRRESHH
jgi:hypothetical protein